MRARLAALALVVGLAVSGCGLSFPGGVHLPHSVPVGETDPGSIQVLPPGPQRDAPADQVVTGFLAAQSDPDHSHAIARSFLSPERRNAWDDTAGVQVYDPSVAPSVVIDDRDPGLVVVTAYLVGRIDRAGSYTAYEPGQVQVRDIYRLRAVATSWVITDLPEGLWLSPGDRDRSFRVRNVYFLGHAYGETSDNPHLVADPVFVPVAVDPAQYLVARLLAGWSAQLGGGAVETAVPSGTSLRGSVTTSAGTVTVDLAAANCRLSANVVQQLSAQLVWTLRGVGPAFLRLALLCQGQPVHLEGRPALQDRGSWAEYDPDGLGAQAQAYFIDHRALRAFDGASTSGPASDGRQPVDLAAVSPGSSLALITTEGLTTVLRTGPLRGPTYVERLRHPGLASPSWGSGEQGLWFLQTGPASSVMLAPNRTDQPPRPVAITGSPAVGELRSLRVSRDGARIALVAGPVADPRLYVGRIEPNGPGGIQVAGLRSVGVGLHDVRDVAWASDTSLMALGRVGAIGPLPVLVAVDGSSVARVAHQGLEQVDPTSIAAAPQRPVIVAAFENRSQTQRLYRDNGVVFADQGPGRAAFYPG